MAYKFPYFEVVNVISDTKLGQDNIKPKASGPLNSRELYTRRPQEPLKQLVLLLEPQRLSSGQVLVLHHCNYKSWL